MASVLNSCARDDIEAIAASKRMNQCLANAQTRNELLTSLAAELTETIEDQVFLAIAERDQQWRYREMLHLGGFVQADEPILSDVYDCASRAIHAGETTCRAVPDSTRRLIAVPVVKQDRCLEILVAKSDPEHVWKVSLAVSLIQQWDTRNGEGDTAALVEIASVIEMTSELESSESTGQAANRIAQFMVESICRQEPTFEASSAVVHVGRAQGESAPALVATSGTPTLSPDHVSLIESAMMETKTRQQALHWPPAKGNRHASLCHTTLAKKLECVSILSFELTDHQGIPQGVILIATDQPLDEATAKRLEAMATPLGSTLEVVSRAQTNRLGKWIQSIREAFQKQKSRMFMIIAALLGALCLIPMPYMVHSDCELQPAVRRFVSVPFESKLERSKIQPGDLVRVGDELARLDERVIRLELAEVDAELYRARKDLDGLLATHQSGEATLARLKAESLAARQQLLRYRFENLILRSPIDGLVVSGDFKDAKGLPLDAGDPMFEIANLDPLLLDVLIPASDIHLVQAGAKVFVRFDALPFERFDLTIDRINPGAEIRDNVNVFVAKASLKNTDGRLRPGMRGSVKIQSSWQPVGWHYLRKPVAHSLRWLGW